VFPEEKKGEAIHNRSRRGSVFRESVDRGKRRVISISKEKREERVI